jgi:hypothetical protein
MYLCVCVCVCVYARGGRKQVCVNVRVYAYVFFYLFYSSFISSLMACVRGYECVCFAREGGRERIGVFRKRGRTH